MFKKLTKTFTQTDFSLKDEVISYGKVISDTFYGIRYNDIDVESKQFFEVIPEVFRKGFQLHSMQINSSVPPHTDSKILTTINFYIKSGNAITTFYDVVSTNPTTTQITNQTNGKMFYIDDLVVASEFVANDFDIYVLDVTKPHSVQLTDPNAERTAFVLQSTCFKFDVVCNMLRKTNCL